MLQQALAAQVLLYHILAGWFYGQRPHGVAALGRLTSTNHPGTSRADAVCIGCSWVGMFSGMMCVCVCGISVFCCFGVVAVRAWRRSGGHLLLATVTFWAQRARPTLISSAQAARQNVRVTVQALHTMDLPNLSSIRTLPTSSHTTRRLSEHQSNGPAAKKHLPLENAGPANPKANPWLMRPRALVSHGPCP